MLTSLHASDARANKECCALLSLLARLYSHKIPDFLLLQHDLLRLFWTPVSSSSSSSSSSASPTSGKESGETSLSQRGPFFGLNSKAQMQLLSLLPYFKHLANPLLTALARVCRHVARPPLGLGGEAVEDKKASSPNPNSQL